MLPLQLSRFAIANSHSRSCIVSAPYFHICQIKVAYLIQIGVICRVFLHFSNQSSIPNNLSSNTSNLRIKCTRVPKLVFFFFTKSICEMSIHRICPICNDTFNCPICTGITGSSTGNVSFAITKSRSRLRGRETALCQYLCM